VTDLHPDFHTTRHAQRMGLPHLQVQHHFAHVLAVMLEHGVPPGTRVLGVSWDGFGYGKDGTPWGAEFLAAGYGGFERFGHFRYMGLPGGDLAARQPWRMALSYLADVYGEELPRVKALDRVEPHLIKGVREMLRQGLNTPEVSSCGRLFDAVSFLAGLAPLQVEYEAEAPMRLEAAADPVCEESYGFQMMRRAGAHNNQDTTKSLAKDDTPQKLPYSVSFAETIKGVVADAAGGTAAGLISARFHNTLAGVITAAAHRAREEQGLDIVVLSGGVFLNRTLLEKAEAQLIDDGFRVLRPLLYSPNDESISVGQIAFALHHLHENGLKNNP